MILTYSNKIILAPMVRIGTLPFRLLALRYGADIVYTEEIIDYKMIECKRIENKLLDTIDFLLADGTVVFRTCKEEKGKLVFQMGTNNAERALSVAQMLEKDIDGIDINMGCPKEFSVKGGMGAALLTQPDKVKQILTGLVQNLSIPVTCKIRILPQLSDTIELAKLIEATGVKAIAIHGRTKDERSSSPCHNDYIKAVADAVNIPVIANGGSQDIKTYFNIAKFKEETGCSSVMIARSAQWNPSVFRKEGILPLIDVIKEYIKVALIFDACFTNIKYVLCKMFGNTAGSELGKRLSASVNLQDICETFDLEDFRQNLLKEREIRRTELESEPSLKKFKSSNCIVLDVTYNRKWYPRTLSPLQKVYDYCMREGLKQPVLKTETSTDKLFKSEILVDNVLYTTKLWAKRKKSAEQGAAIAFLHYNGMHDGRIKEE
ncbi:tRNA-dihydrouridine(20) synthase [NAD(P)+]-like isoform X1 [Hydra vulgaris]|uniref:tRNA-dihydrouridine(20) synthase [NAD(P)+]-like isoform X1 n=1 Tax=Hydra vulgaris TaxID=6087 RepID=UPI001F5EBCE5|nr:tRNA-dihydrouridine(20) synthase [NAD(P)+]-like [Hydra vulgaris]